ncbi:DUF2946 domain-containing protein [Pseudomonas schmalbachii]|uniref:DUF2946 domain-containing protein n=1 Tax=Pseudomonas schmalbachii TaxID=2816993 RepID=A0ABS3TMM1_9PSED|nr:DUF2946 domain-containing protein [Pseudomonas schmalbachii]
MLMIYVGPLVSQSMPMDHAMSMAGGLDELACSDDQRVSGHHAAPDLVAAEKQQFSAEHFMEKCGYCALLVHSPPLVPPVLATPAAPIAIGLSAPVIASQSAPASPVFPGARSRAPPFPVA